MCVSVGQVLHGTRVVWNRHVLTSHVYIFCWIPPSRLSCSAPGVCTVCMITPVPRVDTSVGEAMCVSISDKYGNDEILSSAHVALGSSLKCPGITEPLDSRMCASVVKRRRVREVSAVFLVSGVQTKMLCFSSIVFGEAKMLCSFSPSCLAKVAKKQKDAPAVPQQLPLSM